MKKDYWLRNKKEREGHHENLQQANVVVIVVQDALILSWIISMMLGWYTWETCFMLHPMGTISKTMSKVTLDVCIWLMINHVKLSKKALAYKTRTNGC